MKDLKITFPSPCAENWDEMTPDGRNRFCARCTETIHDLSKYDYEEAIVLLKSDKETCVRAQLRLNGTIVLGSGPVRRATRIVAAVGASVGLMALTPPAYAKKRGPEGAIAGKVDYSWPTIWVTASGTDGKQHHGKTNRYGRYKIKHLPPGTYQIAFSDGDETNWNGGAVIVEDRKTVVRDTENPNPPIIVGMVKVERSDG
jgi:hypothetical protein